MYFTKEGRIVIEEKKRGRSQINESLLLGYAVSLGKIGFLKELIDQEIDTTARELNDEDTAAAINGLVGVLHQGVYSDEDLSFANEAGEHQDAIRLLVRHAADILGDMVLKVPTAIPTDDGSIARVH